MCTSPFASLPECIINYELCAVCAIHVVRMGEGPRESDQSQGHKEFVISASLCGCGVISFWTNENCIRTNCIVKFGQRRWPFSSSETHRNHFWPLHLFRFEKCSNFFWVKTMPENLLYILTVTHRPVLRVFCRRRRTHGRHISVEIHKILSFFFSFSFFSLSSLFPVIFIIIIVNAGMHSIHSCL